MEELIERMNRRIDQQMRPYEDQIKALDQLPGIDRRVAQVIIAETGGDINRFPSEDHLASWAGMCPGNNETAVKRKSGKTTKGSRWLRQALVQAGWGQPQQNQLRGGAVRAVIATSRQESIHATGPNRSYLKRMIAFGSH